MGPAGAALRGKESGVAPYLPFGAPAVGRNRITPAAGPGADAGGRAYSADRLRKSRRVDAGPRLAPLERGGDSAGPGCLPLADREAVLDRKPPARGGGRIGRGRRRLSRAPEPSSAAARALPAGGERSSGYARAR